MRGFHFLTERFGGGDLDHEVVFLQRAAQHHAVFVTRRGQTDLLVEHVFLDRLGIAQQRATEAGATAVLVGDDGIRSEEHTSELQSLMRSSYAVFCLKKK